MASGVASKKNQETDNEFQKRESRANTLLKYY